MAEIDPVLAKQMDQNFASTHQRLNNVMEMSQAGDARVAENLRNSFGFAGSNAATLVGAHAAKNLDQTNAAIVPAVLNPNPTTTGVSAKQA